MRNGRKEVSKKLKKAYRLIEIADGIS